MKRYRAKPVEIEAVQFFSKDAENFPQVKLFLDDSPYPVCRDSYYYVNTLEGPIKICDGDWLIRGVEGEYSPCKDSVFQKKYEPVNFSPTE